MIRLAVLNMGGVFLLAWATWLGFPQFAYANDSTPISLTIVALFVFSLCVTAHRLFVIHRRPVCGSTHEGNEILNDMARWSAGLGMLGTIIGLVLMAFSLRGTDISNADQLAKAISHAFNGYGVALVTTAVGLIFGSWIEVNYRCIKMITAKEMQR